MTRRRPPAAPRPVLSDREHAALTHELVRLCMGGQPARPDLMVASS